MIKFIWIYFCFTCFGVGVSAQNVVLEDGSGANKWQAAPSDGISLLIREGEGIGVGTQAVCMEINFNGRGGWAAAILPVNVDLPENYVLAYDLRGNLPQNKVEVKLISGKNVWWFPQSEVDFPSVYERYQIKKRKITYAWGEDATKPLTHLSAFEFTVVAEKGGSGTVCLDNIAIERRETPSNAALQPTVTASSGDPSGVLDGSKAWQPNDVYPASELRINLGTVHEFGGLQLKWKNREEYVVWTEIGQSLGFRDHYFPSVSGTDILYLPELEAQVIVIQCHDCILEKVEILPVSVSESYNTFFEYVASKSPSGYYPKYLLKQQSYWTIIGTNGGADEALINEEGMVELGKALPSIEPFVKDQKGKLWTWANSQHTQKLEDGYLPLPLVTRNMNGLTLEVAPSMSDSGLVIRYTLKNATKTPQKGSLYLALRPFQVNPSWQFLGKQGGFTPIFDNKRGLKRDSFGFRKKDTQQAKLYLTESDDRVALNNIDIVPKIIKGNWHGDELFADDQDRQGFNSNLWRYDYDLRPNQTKTVEISAFKPSEATSKLSSENRAASAQYWHETLDKVNIDLPDGHTPKSITESIKANLAYVLINRDGAAIQPGSRSYERSWIRDGSLTSAALLRLGHEKEVKAYIEWFAQYIFDNGKVPCCVDWRGADAVPENDSHGQFIFLVAEYYRFTHDIETVRKVWDKVQKAVGYMEALRHQRMTEAYQSGEKRAFYGLMPESISHEGYSAKPMHSFWDDAFALRGYKDAVFLAQILGETTWATQYTQFRDQFSEAFHASLDASMAMHHISYLPGCVELGDFDATSTTVLLDPAQELPNLSRQAVEATFEKYYQFTQDRISGKLKWEAYTPYEWRTVGAMIRLSFLDRKWRNRALDLAQFFFDDQRPQGWHHWAEVVWNNAETSKFIGDMPHTWVGSDFIRSMLSFFVYEREQDESLVLGAGIPMAWIQGKGVSIQNMRTWYGNLSYTMKAKNAQQIEIQFPVAPMPKGGFTVVSPQTKPIRKVIADGQPYPHFEAQQVHFSTLPKQVLLIY